MLFRRLVALYKPRNFVYTKYFIINESTNLKVPETFTMFGPLVLFLKFIVILALLYISSFIQQLNQIQMHTSIIHVLDNIQCATFTVENVFFV